MSKHCNGQVRQGKLEALAVQEKAQKASDKLAREIATKEKKRQGAVEKANKLLLSQRKSLITNERKDLKKRVASTKQKEKEIKNLVNKSSKYAKRKNIEVSYLRKLLASDHNGCLPLLFLLTPTLCLN